MKQGGSRRLMEIVSLPQNFQDAIEITKTLGYEYLWIDSFCITQTSKEDWLEQSAVMASIYAHAEFTIAVLASRGSSYSCFRARNPLHFRPLQVDGLKIQHRSPMHWWNLEINGTESRSSPLHARAWVVQERISAPRTIFFGDLGVYWECRVTKASQGFSQSHLDNENVKMSLITLTQRALDAVSSSIHESTFHTEWRTLIKLYTHCDLTRYTDKLIASSGITKEIERLSGKTYVQGLWKDDLDDSLLWYVKNATWLDSSSPEIVSGRVSNGLPTWSWASTMGPLSYTLPTGSIIWRAHITVENKQHLRIFSWKRQVQVHEEEEEDLVLMKDKTLPGDYEQTYVWWADDLKTKNYGKMWLLIIQRVSISQNPFLGAARCLVIESTDDGLFQRIGWCIVRFNHNRHDPFPSDDATVEHDAAIVLK